MGASRTRTSPIGLRLKPTTNDTLYRYAHIQKTVCQTIVNYSTTMCMCMISIRHAFCIKGFDRFFTSPKCDGR